MSSLAQLGADLIHALWGGKQGYVSEWDLAFPKDGFGETAEFLFTEDGRKATRLQVGFSRTGETRCDLYQGDLVIHHERAVNPLVFEPRGGYLAVSVGYPNESPRNMVTVANGHFFSSGEGPFVDHFKAVIVGSRYPLGDAPAPTNEARLVLLPREGGASVWLSTDLPIAEGGFTHNPSTWMGGVSRGGEVVVCQEALDDGTTAFLHRSSFWQHVLRGAPEGETTIRAVAPTVLEVSGSGERLARSRLVAVFVGALKEAGAKIRLFLPGGQELLQGGLETFGCRLTVFAGLIVVASLAVLSATGQDSTGKTSTPLYG